MLGDPDSGGVWAQCLTCDAGLFYLIYTAVKRYGRTSQPGSVGPGLRGMHNYLVTCQTIDSKWSDPVYSGVL
jgi:xylan 1,4-beta-xylosidase